MGFMSWLTGRDEKESDVYANYDKVSTVVNEITTIGTTKVSNAQTEVNAAIKKLNSVDVQFLYLVVFTYSLNIVVNFLQILVFLIQ